MDATTELYDLWTLADGRQVDVDRFARSCPTNVGPSEDEHFAPGLWVVGHGATGTMYYDHSGRLASHRALLDEEWVDVVAGARWDIPWPMHEKVAQRVWRNRARISAAIITAIGADDAFQKGYRISVTFHDGDQMTVTEYDWGKFQITAEVGW